MKTLVATLAALACLNWVSARASESIDDHSFLIGDVNADNPGVELIVPTMTYTQTGVDFSFSLYRPRSGSTATEGLYRTEVRTMGFPSVSCTGQTGGDLDQKWKFLRSGHFMVAGLGLVAQCQGGEGRRTAYSSYVYVVNAAAPGRPPVLLSYAGKNLTGLSLTDNHNNEGSNADLLVSLLDPASAIATVQLRDFVSGDIYSTNVIQAVTE